jgi:uroporphyrinogen-III decarboxylase
MTRRERLMATLRGQPVDRPAVSFYEIGGWKMAQDGDEFTVWNDPSWRPLVALAHAETDIIRLMSPRWTGGSDSGMAELTTTERWREGDSLFSRTSIRSSGRTLTSVTRRDKSTQTTWVTEHLLKSVDDLRAYLALPDPVVGEPDVSAMAAEEQELGEAGVICVDSGDPICSAASLFSMEDYTVIAMTERTLFRRLLEKLHRVHLPQTEKTARAFPGRMWRICGSEYASEPYLPPELYAEYVTRYTGEMCAAISRYGGYPRIHSHGRLRGILGHIAAMGPAGLDPIEPPPQGDMELREVRAAIGDRVVLMGNIEAADIENLSPPEFERRVARAMREGTAGSGRGFVLHPSSCPYGRTITPQTMANYRTMIRLAAAG